MVRWSRHEPWVVGTALAMTLGACGGSDSSLSEPPHTAELVADSFVGPMGITFDSAGNLYVGSTTGRITRIAPDGTREVFVETAHALAGLATGPQDEIFAALPNEGEVIAVSQGRGIRVATSGLDTPTAIVFDITQRALVSALGRGGEPQIAAIELDTTYHTLTTEIRSPAAMVFGSDGLLYVADTDRNRVVRFELDRFGEAGTLEVYASGITLPSGVAFDQSGDLFVSGGNTVWIVYPDDRPLDSFVVDGAIDYPAELAFGMGTGRDTGDLYFANFGFPLGSATFVSKTHVGIPGVVPYAP